MARGRITSTRQSKPSSAAETLRLSLRVPRRLRLFACYATVFALMIAADGSAQVLGSNGEPGANGERGRRGGDGAPGEPGGDAIRESTVTNGPNAFSAIGGNGGSGGEGSGSGNGGDGALGGSARATAITRNASATFGETSIEALGGHGGSGGQLGRFASVASALGADGGRAEAFADVVGADVTASAIGGSGGWGNSVGSDAGPGGTGGDSGTEVNGRSLGNESIVVRAASTAGSGGRASFDSTSGDGGFAESAARGIGSGSGSVTVSANSRGGWGGGRHLASRRQHALGGEGGSAEAQAYGESLNGGTVSVSAYATGGTTLGDGEGGSAEAHAYGESHSGGTVNVIANAVGGDAWRGRGGSVRLVDAADGRTSGRLELYQSANGGESQLGAGGSAESRLSRRNEDGGAIRLVAVARGGEGGVSGGDAVASVTGIGHGDVSVDAMARGGQATAEGGSRGSARLDQVYGKSLGGGAVSVRASLSGTSGAAAATDSRLASPDVPLDAIVDGIAQGDTSGNLLLSQTVSGGHTTGAAIGDGPIVRAGSVLNRLERSVSASHLTVDLDSWGGGGDSYDSPSEGGSASTFARLVNTTGGVYFDGSTRGGDGAVTSPSNRGGDALRDIGIKTHGDGSDIQLVPARARGGDSYRYRTSIGGTSGNAISRSVATAFGDSAVTVVDQAEAGIGRLSGNASSFASGANAGSRPVFVVSNANTGWVTDVGEGANWGVANSEAHGFSPNGTVEVEASASSNKTSPVWRIVSESWRGGSATATATADGRSSHVRAHSTGIAGALGEQGLLTRATARGDGGGSINAHAVAGANLPLPRKGSGVEVSVAMDGIHSLPGEWGRGSIDIRADRTDTDIVLGGDLAFVHDALENPISGLFVSFLAVDLDADDFATLAIRVGEGDQPLLDRSFDDAASALAFFAEPLSIGALMVGLPPRYRLDREFVISIEGVGVSPETDFHLALAVAHHVVPEPSTMLLISIGFLILGSQKPER